jgi:outer membrane protein assembly factor BamA
VSSALGVSLQLDSRNSLTAPRRGHLVLVDYLRNATFLGGDFDYDYLVVDARLYLPVWRGRDVVALNLYGEFNGAEVPIQTMSMLSNATTQELMRGVYLGRFRDQHEWAAQADYRGHLKGRFGYVVFGAAGTVFGSAGTSPVEALKFTYGAGIRFNVNPADPINLRADFTLNSFGEPGFTFGATEAF